MLCSLSFCNQAFSVPELSILPGLCHRIPVALKIKFPCLASHFNLKVNMEKERIDKERTFGIGFWGRESCRYSGFSNLSFLQHHMEKSREEE